MTDVNQLYQNALDSKAISVLSTDEPCVFTHVFLSGGDIQLPCSETILYINGAGWSNLPKQPTHLDISSPYLNPPVQKNDVRDCTVSVRDCNNTIYTLPPSRGHGYPLEILNMCKSEHLTIMRVIRLPLDFNRPVEKVLMYLDDLIYDETNNVEEGLRYSELHQSRIKALNNLRNKIEQGNNCDTYVLYTEVDLSKLKPCHGYYHSVFDVCIRVEGEWDFSNRHLKSQFMHPRACVGDWEVLRYRLESARQNKTTKEIQVIASIESLPQDKVFLADFEQNMRQTVRVIRPKPGQEEGLFVRYIGPDVDAEPVIYHRKIADMADLGVFAHPEDAFAKTTEVRNRHLQQNILAERREAEKAEEARKVAALAAKQKEDEERKSKEEIQKAKNEIWKHIATVVGATATITATLFGMFKLFAGFMSGLLKGPSLSVAALRW